MVWSDPRYEERDSVQEAVGETVREREREGVQGF